MVIFHSYVSLPEVNHSLELFCNKNIGETFWDSFDTKRLMHIQPDYAGLGMSFH
jgi:hypothetical protein